MFKNAALPLLLALMVISALACGGDDDSDGGATGAPTRPTPTPSFRLHAPRLHAPYEGVEPGQAAAYTDYHQDPQWQLPQPEDLPEPDDPDDTVLNPGGPSECPGEWTNYERVPEGYQICYPPEWVLANESYINSPNESRWFAAGFFNFTDDTRQHQLAHVSVYVMPKYARPILRTLTCVDAYSTTLAGEPAVVCPDSVPLVPPEARIITYHVYENEVDYFVNIALYYEYDSDDDEYTDDTDEASLETALEIVSTFRLQPIPIPVTPQPTDAASPTP